MQKGTPHMNQLWLQTLQAHLEAGHLSRRDFIKRAAALGLSAPAIAAVLAACGGDDDNGADSTATNASSSGAAESSPTSGGVTINQNVTPTTSAGGSPVAESSPTSAPTGAAGGAVTFSRQVDSENLDPVTQDGNINIWIFMSIYDQLIRVDQQGIDLLPGLATDWSVSDDNLTYTFTIRQGVKYSDGSDLTTED